MLACRRPFRFFMAVVECCNAKLSLMRCLKVLLQVLRFLLAGCVGFCKGGCGFSTLGFCCDFLWVVWGCTDTHACVVCNSAPLALRPDLDPPHSILIFNHPNPLHFPLLFTPPSCDPSNSREVVSGLHYTGPNCLTSKVERRIDAWAESTYWKKRFSRRS